MSLLGVNHGIEITTLADITSEGSGLGSSSSFTVGMLHALHAYKGDLPTADDLASQACKIEIDTLKRPIGKQDQYIAAYGGLRFITFNGHGIHAERVELSREMKQRLNRNLMLFYTGLNRKSATVLESQKNNIGSRIYELGRMKKFAFEACQCLRNGAFDDFGEIMHQGWEYKKTLAEKVSNTDIDSYYTAARNAGAIGGKICGAGGGGFLLVYCKPEKQDAVREALKPLREYAFNLKDDGSKVIFNYQG